MDFSQFNRRPIIVAIAGPNGAGKSTFFQSQLATTRLPFVNADLLAAELKIDAYEAARLANAMRLSLVERRESFIFETVFSDPVGDKVSFLEDAVQQGYEVVLCFIALAGVSQSIERVAMRVLQGEHDVPEDKLRARYPRTLANLQAAISRLPHVIVYDNSDISMGHRLVAEFDHGVLRQVQEPTPEWLKPLLG